MIGALPMCTLCRIPIATAHCRHAYFEHDRVVMSYACWLEMVEDVNELRVIKADEADAEADAALE